MGGKPVVAASAPGSESGDARRVDQLMFAAVGYRHALTLGPVSLRAGLWVAYERNTSTQNRKLGGRFEANAYSFSRLRLRPSASASWGAATLALSYEHASRDYAARRVTEGDALANDLSSLLRAEGRYALGDGAEVGLYALSQDVSSNQTLAHFFASKASVTQVGLLARFYAE